MTISDQTWRRTLRDLCRLGAVGSLVMLILAVSTLWNGTGPVTQAASAGPVVVQGGPGTGTAGQTITTGGSATAFTFLLPAGAGCTGDSASGGYRVQTYMVPAAVDPQTLKFNFLGPNPAGSGAAYAQPLFRSASGQAFVNVTTGIAEVSGGPGQVPTLPGFDFSSTRFVSGFVLPGTYNVGIMCTKAAGAEVDKYWNTQLTFATSATDLPNGLTWEVSGGATTTTTTTTTVPAATTTTVAGATTTTVAGATTTTTVAGGTTTTTVAGGASQAATLSPAVPTAGGTYKVTHPNCRVGETITVTQPQSTPTSATATCALPVAGLVRPEQAAAVGTATVTFTAAPTTPGTYTVTSTGATSGTRTATFVIVGVTSTTVTSSGGSTSGTSTGTIPSTGSSTTSIIVWGILLLVFGRIALLLGRKPKVISTGP